MTSLQDLESLVATLEQAGIENCVYTFGSQTIRLEFERSSASTRESSREPSGASASKPVSRSADYLRAPCSGHFVRTHPFLDCQMADVGSCVEESQHVAYIEVDSVFFPVIAPFSGRLGLPAAVDGQRVGYGAALIEISRSETEMKG